MKKKPPATTLRPQDVMARFDRLLSQMAPKAPATSPKNPKRRTKATSKAATRSGR